MARYEIWESVDGTETALTGADATGDAQRQRTTTDTEGRPMRLVKAFDAADWDEAKRVLHAHYGWEPPRPTT